MDYRNFVLTTDIIEIAVGYALPIIRSMIKGGGTWGPEGLVIGIKAPILDDAYIHVMEELGVEEEWESQYGKGKNFRIIVLQKISTALKGLSSAEVVLKAPWALQHGDSLFQGAVVRHIGDITLVVAASGGYGQTDEAAAEIVMDLIVWLCALDVRTRQENGDYYIK